MSKTNCPHTHFNYTAKLVEFTPTDKKPTDRPFLLLAVSANCDDCGQPFIFYDMEVPADVPEGMMRYCSHVSVDGTTVYHPVAVASECQLIKETMN